MSHVDPTSEQFSAMMNLPDDGPFQMLNLIKLREKAVYDDGRIISGEEAYRIYNQLSEPIFKSKGGRIFASWDPQLVLVGPEGSHWDIIDVAEWPGMSAFAEMVTDPEYEKIMFHRQAAVEDCRLIKLKQNELIPDL